MGDESGYADILPESSGSTTASVPDQHNQYRQHRYNLKSYENTYSARESTKTC